MQSIVQKFEAQNKKVNRMRERNKNKPCTMCRNPISKYGLSSIPGICKKCEDEAVHGSIKNPQY